MPLIEITNKREHNENVKQITLVHISKKIEAQEQLNLRIKFYLWLQSPPPSTHLCNIPVLLKNY